MMSVLMTFSTGMMSCEIDTATISVLDRKFAGALVQWSKVCALKVGDCGFDPAMTFKCQGNKMFLSRLLEKIQYYGKLL